MKKLLVLFALLCLAAYAGKPAFNPQIALGTCSRLLDGNCDSNASFSLVLTGLDPHKLYVVSATATDFADSTPGGVLNPDNGTYTLDLGGVLGAGDWTFTLLQVNHNGTPTAQFAPPAIVTFD